MEIDALTPRASIVSSGRIGFYSKILYDVITARRLESAASKHSEEQGSRGEKREMASWDGWHTNREENWTV